VPGRARAVPTPVPTSGLENPRFAGCFDSYQAHSLRAELDQGGARCELLRRTEHEADRLGQRPKLVQRPLAAASQREHEQVEARLTGGWLLGDQLLDEEYPSSGVAGLDTPADDPPGAVVGVAVEDLRENVGVAARQRIREEIAGGGGESLRRLRRSDDAGQVEQPSRGGEGVRRGAFSASHRSHRRCRRRVRSGSSRIRR
jgi:hypothetical protein